MFLADNGSGIFLSGAPDNRWNNDDLSALKNLTAADFEVVKMDTIYTPATVPTGPPPVIQSFTAKPSSISAGTSVQLCWAVKDSEYNIIDPTLGAVRGDSAVVKPTHTTTYLLIATNQFGRSSRSVTVTVKNPYCPTG